MSCTHTLPCHWCVVNEGCVVVSRSHPSRPFTQPHPMVYETAHVARKKTSGGWNINVYKMEGLIVHLIVWEHLCGILRVPIGFPKPPMEFPRGVHNASVTQHTLYIAQTMWCANYVSRILCRVDILRLHIFNCNDDNDMLSQNVTLFVHSVCNCNFKFFVEDVLCKTHKGLHAHCKGVQLFHWDSKSKSWECCAWHCLLNTWGMWSKQYYLITPNHSQNGCQNFYNVFPTFISLISHNCQITSTIHAYLCC